MEENKKLSNFKTTVELVTSAEKESGTSPPAGVRGSAGAAGRRSRCVTRMAARGAVGDLTIAKN